MAKTANGHGGANLGFEATLWAAADKMRNNMDVAESKHVVLGLMFLKYISDAFEEQAGMLRRMIEANNRQSQTLAGLRDALLPKPLSGAVRVKETAKLIEKHL